MQREKKTKLCFVLCWWWYYDKEFFKGPDKAGDVILGGRIVMWLPCLENERSRAIMVEKWGSREDACPNLKVTERYMESTWLIEMTWNLNPRQGQSGNGEEIVGK